MMRKLLPFCAFPLLLSCGSGDPGAPGAQGDPGPTGPQGMPGPPGPGAVTPPTLTGISPLSTFPDRVVQLQLSGIGTHFGKDTAVRFTDPALTVTKISV